MSARDVDVAVIAQATYVVDISVEAHDEYGALRDIRPGMPAPPCALTLVIEAVDDRPTFISVVGGAPSAEPEAHDLHLPALRSATPRHERAHTARSGGGSKSAPTRPHRLRPAGAQCRQAPHPGRVAQDQAVLAGPTQAATSRPLADSRVPHVAPRAVGCPARFAGQAARLHRQPLARADGRGMRSTTGGSQPVAEKR